MSGSFGLCPVVSLPSDIQVINTELNGSKTWKIIQ